MKRSFFKLAAMFLKGRWELIHGRKLVPCRGKIDDCGCYVGMQDNAFEMRLICREVINGRD